MNATGYRLGEILYQGALVTVRRAVTANGDAVVLKRLERPRPGSSDMLHFRREHDITRRLSGPGVVSVLALEDGRDGLTLVMTDSGGTSLEEVLTKEGPPGLADSLRIAIAVAATLGRVHAARIIHKDVAPANIIWNRASGRVELIDFGIAAELAHESAANEGGQIEGTVCYMSPEQTGRMNRGLDWRTDFYSLGATLYRLLTGRPPFEGADTLAVIHGHIARAPLPPHQVNAEVPPGLSDVVLKLLAKDPEERYQSAYGLKADLEACLEQWESTGAVHAFPLGCKDRSERFQIPGKLYGREEQFAKLMASFERVAADRAELLLISGAAGIGKSALVHEVQKPMSGRRGWFIEGKFDQFKHNVPYSGMIQALGALARQLLAETEAALNERCAALLKAVGVNGAIVTELIPEFLPILGPQPAVPPLPPSESEFRFQLTFQNLVLALTAPERPLVLFLDDLQWADRPSLGLLAKLITDPEMRHLLVIGACRDGGMEPGQPLARMVEQVLEAGRRVEMVGIGPLSPADIRRLVAETVRRDNAEIGDLAALCLAKTQGNPFFLSQFLLSLHEKELIRLDHDSGAWVWDLAAAADIDSTDNVIDLMVAKIRRLEPATVTALSLAACVGDRFDLANLAAAGEQPAARLTTALWPALREGLIAPLGHACRYVEAVQESRDGKDDTLALGNALHPARARYRFLHDRVRQAAYSLIPEAERAAMHLRIGRRLLAGLAEPERSEDLFDILDHLNRGAALLGEADERRRLAVLNLAAVRRAKDAAAFEPALRHAQTGIGLLGSVGWEADYALTLTLHEEAAEAAYMSGDPGLMDELAGTALRRVRSPRDLVRIHYIRVTASMTRSEPLEAVRIGLEALRSIGIHVPEHPSKLTMLWMLLRGKAMLKRRAGRPAKAGVPPPDQFAAQVAALATIVFGAVFFARKDLVVPIAFRTLELALSSRDPGLGALSHVAWSVISSVTNHGADAARHGRLALELARETVAVRAAITHGALFFGGHWNESMAVLRPAFWECHILSLSMGDREYAGHSLLSWLRLGWQTGVNLAQMKTEAAEVARIHHRLGNTFHIVSVNGFRQAIANLHEGAETLTRLDGTFMNEEAAFTRLREIGNFTALANILVLKLHLVILFGDGITARALVTEVKKLAAALNGTAGFSIYFLLAALAEATEPLAEGGHAAAARRMAPHIRWFRKAVIVGRANHFHRLRLLEAERRRLLGDTLGAMALYREAIAAAREAGFVGEEALFNERAGRFFEDLGDATAAMAYRSQARDLYRRWGAAAKVSDLEKRHPAIVPVPRAAATTLDATVRTATTSLPDIGFLDANAIMKAAQAISGEIRREALLGTLLRTVLENAGAQRGLLLLPGPDGQLRLAAEGDAAAERYDLLPDLALDTLAANGLPRLCSAIVAYGLRTHETVVLADAASDPRFADDPYVRARKPRSVLCLPLLRQGGMVGLLYLENNLATGAFISRRLEAPRLLAAQIAISLENARLYDEMSAFNRRLEAQVAERTRELTEQSQLLEATLASMTDALAVFDKEHRLRLWNSRVNALIPIPGLLRPGVAYEEIVEALRRFGLVGRDDDLPFIGGPEEIDLANGHVLQVRRNPMPDGGMVRVYLDVTEDRNRERELRAAHEQLKTAQKQLVQVEKMASLGQLVAGVAHEINTPLGIALTSASYLADQTARLKELAGLGKMRKSDFEGFMSKAGEAAGLLVSNIGRVGDLVQGFKKIAVDEASDERRAFRLHARLEDVVAGQAALWRPAGHRFMLDCPPDLEMEGYPGVLSQILSDLVGNAVVHAYAPGQSGTLSLTARPLGGGMVELVFADDGRGIPAEHRGKVFDPFFTTRRGAGNTGLGLHIVYNLVTGKLGGRIDLDSEEGRGTRLSLRLPQVAG